MKKYVLIAIYMATVIFSGCARQTGKALVTTPIKTAGAHYLNEISSRAVRDFVDRHSEAVNVEWYKITGGYVARFLLKGNKARATYKNNGNWVHTIQYYKEAAMPRDIRDIVKRVYYDYTITQVEEIRHVYLPVVYVVHLEDAVTWRNVRVFEGQMDVMEVYNK